MKEKEGRRGEEKLGGEKEGEGKGEWKNDDNYGNRACNFLLFSLCITIEPRTPQGGVAFTIIL